MAVSELSEKFIKEAEARVKEIEPVVAEHTQLVAELAALKGSNETQAPKQRRGRKPGRKGNRRQEFLNIVKENPGISVSEVASQMGIKPNYLYRIKSEMQKSGELTTEGSGLKVA